MGQDVQHLDLGKEMTIAECVSLENLNAARRGAIGRAAASLPDLRYPELEPEPT